MYRLGNPYTLAFGATAVLMFALAAVTLRHRSSRVAVPLAGFMTSVGLWALGDAVRIAAPTPGAILFWNRVAYLGIVGVAPSYLYFVAAITNRERWFDPRYLAGIVAISAVAYVVVLTNSVHGLWRAGETFSPGTAPPVLDERRGVLWYPWAVYAYGLIASGVYWLGRDALESSRSRLYRTRVGLVLVAILVPWVANSLFTTFGVLQFDPVPISLAVTGLAFATAIYRYDLLEVAPIARDVVLSNLDSGVVVLDAGDRVVDANERARAVLDLDPGDVPGIDLATVLSGYPDVLDRLAGTRTASETLSVDADGDTRHYEVDVSPIEDDLGTDLGRVIVFTDVTDRIDRERNLRDRTDRLRRRNDRLDELASIVSHDLRNPLDVTGRRARRLRSVVEDVDLDPGTRAAVREELDGIERATDRASDIAGELLAKSRDHADGPQADDGGSSTPVALRSVAGTAWDTVDTGDLDLSVHGSRPLDADEDDLRRLLENCYRNVVDHADGATTVTVGVTGDGFYVEDDGRGIPESERDRVLERGYSMAADGSGLGLAIVEDVASDYGWSVSVDESEAGGTRVAVRTDPT